MSVSKSGGQFLGRFLNQFLRFLREVQKEGRGANPHPPPRKTHLQHTSHYVVVFTPRILSRAVYGYNMCKLLAIRLTALMAIRLAALVAANPSAQVIPTDGAAPVAFRNPCPTRYTSPMCTTSGDVAVHRSVPYCWLLVAYGALLRSVQSPEAVPLLPVLLPHTRRDERPRIHAWCEGRRYDLFHEDAGIEETHRDAVWEKIAWYL